MRVGNGMSPVDNLHFGGICGCVDVDTGVVIAPCINNNMDKFIVHPSSGKIMVGFQLPLWKELKEVVSKIVQVVPQVEYVGWDFAFTKDGIALIEGNHDPGHDVVQMIAQTGIYGKIKQIIKSQSRKKK